MEMLDVRDCSDWRRWLAANHGSSAEVWLVFHKRHTGVASIAYEAAVEEALCFGWIDSIIRRLDDDRYARKFTPRKLGSAWSEANKKRAERMIAQQRMTEAGREQVDAAKASGEWDRVRRRPDVSADEIPEELRAALAASPEAAAAFEALAPTYRKQYVLWIRMAKRPETRLRRTEEAVDKLRRGERLGLK